MRLVYPVLLSACISLAHGAGGRGRDRDVHFANSFSHLPQSSSMVASPFLQHSLPSPCLNGQRLRLPMTRAAAAASGSSNFALHSPGEESVSSFSMPSIRGLNDILKRFLDITTSSPPWRNTILQHARNVVKMDFFRNHAPLQMTQSMHVLLFVIRYAYADGFDGTIFENCSEQLRTVLTSTFERDTHQPWEVSADDRSGDLANRLYVSDPSVDSRSSIATVVIALTSHQAFEEALIPRLFIPSIALYFDRCFSGVLGYQRRKFEILPRFYIIKDQEDMPSESGTNDTVYKAFPLKAIASPIPVPLRRFSSSRSHSSPHVPQTPPRTPQHAQFMQFASTPPIRSAAAANLRTGTPNTSPHFEAPTRHTTTETSPNFPSQYFSSIQEGQQQHETLELPQQSSGAYGNSYFSSIQGQQPHETLELPQQSSGAYANSVPRTASRSAIAPVRRTSTMSNVLYYPREPGHGEQSPSPPLLTAPPTMIEVPAPPTGDSNNAYSAGLFFLVCGIAGVFFACTLSLILVLFCCRLHRKNDELVLSRLQSCHINTEKQPRTDHENSHVLSNETGSYTQTLLNHLQTLQILVQQQQAKSTPLQQKQQQHQPEQQQPQQTTVANNSNSSLHSYAAHHSHALSYPHSFIHSYPNNNNDNIDISPIHDQQQHMQSQPQPVRFSMSSPFYQNVIQHQLHPSNDNNNAPGSAPTYPLNVDNKQLLELLELQRRASSSQQLLHQLSAPNNISPAMAAVRVHPNCNYKEVPAVVSMIDIDNNVDQSGSSENMFRQNDNEPYSVTMGHHKDDNQDQNEHESAIANESNIDIDMVLAQRSQRRKSKHQRMNPKMYASGNKLRSTLSDQEQQSRIGEESEGGFLSAVDKPLPSSVPSSADDLDRAEDLDRKTS